jgi:sugar lactone lactonase YvrE
MWIAVALGVGCGATPTTPSPPPDPLVAKLVAILDDTLRQRPDDRVALYQRARMASEVGAPAGALPFLERLDALGWDVPFSPEHFETFAENARFRAVAGRVEARAVRVARSSVAFTVPEPDLIPEGIAVDPRTRTFYLGSIRKRKVLAIDAHGKVSTFVPPERDGLLGVLGIKVDPRADVLWVASYASRSMTGRAATPQRPGVFAFSLRDGTLRRRILFDEDGTQQPNDLAIAPDGTVFVTDSAGGRVLRIPADRDVIEVVTPPGALMYPNGIARATDGRLYVAHLGGIAIIDPLTGSVAPLPAAADVPLGGIDGLALEGDRLLAVQNGIGRPRMITIALGENGTRATTLTVLENDHAALEIPTTACVLDGALYTIANSQLRAFRNRDTPAKPLEPPRILRTPI